MKYTSPVERIGITWSASCWPARRSCCNRTLTPRSAVICGLRPSARHRGRQSTAVSNPRRRRFVGSSTVPADNRCFGPAGGARYDLGSRSTELRCATATVFGDGGARWSSDSSCRCVHSLRCSRVFLELGPRWLGPLSQGRLDTRHDDPVAAPRRLGL